MLVELFGRISSRSINVRLEALAELRSSCSAIKKNEFEKQPAIIDSMKHAAAHGSRLHLLGLVSDGGVHSHIQHLFALLRTAKDHKIEHVYIHFFGDGRDTAPRSATKYLQQLQDYIKEIGVGEISTVAGRYYAMDRDKRWDRVKIAVDALTDGTGDKVNGEDLIKTVEDGYAKDITDEFIKPIISGSEGSRIKSKYISRSNPSGNCSSCRGRHPFHVQLPIGPNARNHRRLWSP